MGLIAFREREVEEWRRDRLLRPCRLFLRFLLSRSLLPDSSLAELDEVSSSEELEEVPEDEESEGDPALEEDPRWCFLARSTSLRAAPR